VKRKRVVEISTEQVRQRENIENSETGANGCLSITLRIPGQADAGSKIAQRWILDHGLAGGLLRIPDVVEIGCQVIGFAEHSGRFVTHSKIQGEIGTNAEIVLGIEAENLVANAPVRAFSGYGTSEQCGIRRCQKVTNRIEG